MAVAAYASVTSLLHVLDNIQLPSRHRLFPNMKQIQTLPENLHFMLKFLEVHSFDQGENNRVLDLTRQIAEVANEAEDIIGSRIVVQLCQEYEGTIDAERFLSFYQDIDKVSEKVVSIIELLELAAEGNIVREQHPKVSSVPAAAKPDVVGLDKPLLQIMDQLTGDKPNLQIIPIVGMGGIGKTTLARLAFQKRYIVYSFDLRVWITFSQEYSVRHILQGILRDNFDLKNENLSVPSLGYELYLRLQGRRYLIVMDDVWSTEAWDALRSYFPVTSYGSRIIVTTRLSNVAVSLRSNSNIPYLVNFLDKDNSWNLFCAKTFPQRICPPELVELGKQIVKSCRGLPLAIIAIGRFLAKSNMTREYWELVAENVSFHANSENDEQCLKILALSYHHLPIHLKPCFLYMRVFPEDYDIKVSKLIKLWIGEGLLKPSRAKSLEEVANEYLKDLIDRNLILIRKRGHTGKVKTCGIHDLLRDFCIREYPQKHTLCVPKVQYIDLDTRKKDKCFLCSDMYIVEEIELLEVILGSRSSPITKVCHACRNKYPQLATLKFVNGMLEVDVVPIKEFPQPTSLRYLTVNCERHLNFSSVSSIPVLWNLQTLIIDGPINQPIVLPSEIWEMPQLRHVKIRKAVLPDPVSNQIDRRNHTILENLQTLSSIMGLKFTEEVLQRIPNIKKLHLYFPADSFLRNLSRLSKLESLKLAGNNFSSGNMALPRSLKTLELNGCEMAWTDMSIIGALPNLEVLKLRSGAFKGFEWNPIEGEFPRLRILLVESVDLVRWRAECVHFPCLETLELRVIKWLEGIPSGIGDIDTLRSILLFRCTDGVMNSAERLIEAQRDMRNDNVEVYVTNAYGRRKL